jgi:Zn-finger protein
MAKCGYWNAHHEHDVIYHNTCVLNVLINLFWCLNHKINEWIEMLGFSHVILMNKCLVKIHLHQKDVKERL